MKTFKRLAAFVAVLFAVVAAAAPGAFADTTAPPIEYGKSCVDYSCNTAYVAWGYQFGPGYRNRAYHVHSTDKWKMYVDGEYQHGGEDGWGAEVWFGTDCNLYLDDYRINSWNGDRYDWRRLWNTTLKGLSDCNLRWQTNNNIVIYDKDSNPRWATGTIDYQGPNRFVIQDNGYLLVREHPWYGGAIDLWCEPQPC